MPIKEVPAIFRDNWGFRKLIGEFTCFKDWTCLWGSIEGFTGGL
jgi:hypothetical protein